MRRALIAGALVLAAAAAAAQDRAWLTWSAAQAEGVGKSTYVQGRVGSRATMRLLKTERAINYKLAATWMTPDVIHAAARLLQLRSRLTDAQAIDAVSQARAVGDTVIMVDLDPNEGSGVIPLDWEAFLQPKDAPDRAVAGTKAPKARDVKALAGVMTRNYDYDRFWVVFPLSAPDGQPLFRDSDAEAELVVRIGAREGRVHWPIPSSIRQRSSE